MRKKTLFNNDWYFTKEKVDINNLDYSLFQSITLPHTWNNLDGQDGGDDYDRNAYTYAKKFLKPEGEEVWLQFNAVSLKADVYLNGNKLAEHDDGFSIFRVNLTSALKEGENELVVIADNGVNDYIYPQFADFTFFGGIYRDVYLICVDKSHFALDMHGNEGLKLTPIVEGDKARVNVIAFTSNYEGELTYEIYDQDNKLVETKLSKDKEVNFEIDQPHLWNGRKDPYLYTCVIKMPSDEIKTRFGIRSFSVDPDTGFYLNGVSLPLRGVSRHQCREDKGWAISYEDMKEDIELIKEVGANTIRLAHYQHAQEFYDLCDEAGMVVWAEVPMISRFLDNQKGHDNIMNQMEELIMQSYNHPSICFWGISNEITIGGENDEHLDQNLIELNDLCHQLDSTRLTTMAQVSMLSMENKQNLISDVVSYNHYFGWYGGKVEENGPWLDKFHEMYPQRCLGLSEYGAEGNINFHSEDPVNHDYTEEYQCLYHEGMLKTFETRPYLWATHIWNMFEFASDMRDEGDVRGRNNKGLVNFNRTIKKDSFYLYKAYWSDETFLHLCSKRYVKRLKDTKLKAYANNTDSVEFFVNGVSVGVVEGDKIFELPVTLNEKENLIEVKANGLLDSMTIIKVEEAEPSYIYNGGAAMTSWYENGEKKDLTFNEGYFSIRDKIGDIMENQEASEVLQKLFAQMQSAEGGMAAAMSQGEEVMKMMRSMKLVELIPMMGKMLPEGSAYYINEELAKIKKN